MSIIKKPYEISLWEDTLIFVGESGTPYEDITKAEEAIVNQYYKETRLCTIGSDAMDSPARAVNGKLVRKVNGEVTFTFTVYYRYYDNQTGQLEYNPFVPYLTNERKVKLKYDDEWYDLIIKQIQENSESKAFTYTCKSQFVNELSKTGFELEFDNELENNMGTIEYLAEQILAGSDWQLEGNSGLKQFIEEPLYKVKIKSDAQLDIAVMNPIGERENVPSIAGKEIYVFYSHINDKETEWQFLYDDDPFSINDDLVIDKDIYPNYLIKSVSYAKDRDWPEFVQYGSITSDYRGMRLVKQVRTIYDAKIDKYVQEYTKKDDTSGTIYYGFEETKYLSPNAVNNYVVNPNAFTSTTGWYVQPNEQGAKATLELVSDPPFNAENIGDDSINFTSYLKFPNNGGALVNSSINSHKSSLEGFVEKETTYVLRLKCKQIIEDEVSTNYITPASAKISQYKDMTNFENIGEPIFIFKEWNLDDISTNEQDRDFSFVYYKASCERAITQADLQNWDKYYGLFLTFDTQYAEVCIEDIQMFPYVLDNNQRLCVPGGELFAKVETTKKYYDPSETYSSLEEIEFEPAQPEGTYLLKYTEGAEAYTKVSSITAKESNRFNLLQDLNEKFECWARFRVEHNEETGEILYGKDKKWYDENGKEIECPENETYRQQKFISFHEYAGQHNYAGFKYGINSKSIQRTLDSNAIVSKMIVKDNANEFARNGFCSIARAVNNSSKENFVLNFDHYYRHRLLDLDVVTNDLYVTSNGYLGYYKQLKEINRDREGLIDEQANLLKEIANYEAQYQTYKTSHDSAIEERNQMEDNIFLLIVPKEDRDKDKSEGGAKGLEFAEIISKYSTGWEENSSYIKYSTSWMQCDNVIKQHLFLYQKAYEHLNGVKDENDNIIKQGVKERYEEITELLKEKTEQKRALNLQFYKKYSRFIQEGSWIKEDYVDDNLYYLDSLSTLHTSAQPKVTYNISVINVSSLPGYEDYEFKLGDITYIEDREFFGYSLIDGTTPYREEIVVSEITTELDAPEKNLIKVQNYKTQFEDLFQRITAQTQQAEYHTGEYKRAASIVEPNGNISVSTLENSFANNSFKLSNIRDQSVVIDSSGITTTSLANPSEMLRIVNGGIFMSTDGGQSWKTGLTGYGLNSSYLTAGQINTDEIYIMSGNQPAFGWDEKGISAYSSQDKLYNLNKYVRFDQYGIYGAIGDDDWSPSGLEDIHNNARFALTWNGFSLKNAYGNGYVGINSEQDLIVNDGKQNRIQIGNINSGSDRNDNPIYGIRISNASGDPIMVTRDGELWLTGALHIKDKETDGSAVSIGNLVDSTNSENNRIIDADGMFVVYENGSIKAMSGEIGGLIIGSTITNDQTTHYLEAKQNTNIEIRGQTLTFSGQIEAAEGGNIGGFKIEEGEMVSSDLNSIRLNGIEGSIYAKTITLGENAKIDDYMAFGKDAYIYNPAKHEGKFIEAGNIKILANGEGAIGSISFDGNTSNIWGDNWSISPDKATFSNVYVSGEIETAVFKKNSIQAAGGAMIFRPSYKIESINSKEDGYEIVLDEYFDEEKPGNTVQIICNSEGVQKTSLATVSSINSSNKKSIIVTMLTGQPLSAESEPVCLVDLGRGDDMLIGINSANGAVLDGKILGRGLTVTSRDRSRPNLFLGDLSSVELSGYGLYSDNVYLNGSLTTKSGSGKSAGVNTTTGVKSDSNLLSTESNIIFWAGASDTTDSAIKKAPFQVTENGYVYVKNSIFAGGSITGTDIYAARIHGIQGQDALKIYDTGNGIGFYKGYIDDQDQGVKTCGIDSQGFYANGNNVSIRFLVEQEGSYDNLSLFSDGLFYITQGADSGPTYKTGISLTSSEIKFKFDNSEYVKISNEKTQILNELTLGQNGAQMKYTEVGDGYDLYVIA